MIIISLKKIIKFEVLVNFLSFVLVKLKNINFIILKIKASSLISNYLKFLILEILLKFGYFEELLGDLIDSIDSRVNYGQKSDY